MQKQKPRLGCALIIKDKQGGILLGRRAKKPFFGYWILPGGGIDFLESYKETAKREAMEELGIEISIEKFFTVAEIISPPDEHRVIVYLECSHSGGEIVPSSDVSEASFFNSQELEEIMCGKEVTPTVKNILEEYLKGH